MAKKPNLPAAVHDHFRKANKLHTYVEKELGEATKHALEIGIHLLAAKKAVPHGSWEDECDRLFDGSLRTAQFYMQFTRDFGKIKTADKSAVLMLESTLKGAAKAARLLVRPAKPTKPKPEPAEPQEAEGVHRCPGCGGEDFHDDGTCRACIQEETPGVIDTPSEAVCEAPGEEPDDEAEEEPDEPESDGTCLKSALMLTIQHWQEERPDAPECLVLSILESLTADWRGS